MPPDAKSPRPVGGSGDHGMSSFCGEDLPTSTRQGRTQGKIRSEARARLRRQRLVEHLHRLGPSPLGHFLREVENGASIADHLEAYARIDPEFVRALGGADFLPFLHVIGYGET
jgi:hypothetical protein